MLGHSLVIDQEEMVRRYREKIRLQVEEELRERRSQNHVEDTFSVPIEKIERPIRDERTTLEKAIGIPPIREDKNIISKARRFLLNACFKNVSAGFTIDLEKENLSCEIYDQYLLNDSDEISCGLWEP